jgi:hypothetical protein
MPVPARHVSRLAVVVALLLALAACVAATADARSARAVLAFLPRGGDGNPDPVLQRLAARPQLALGLVSATQGRYTPAQAMLDITAGARTAAAVYDPRDPPQLELVPAGDGSGFVSGWARVLERADTAPAEITPGLLATRIPGGAAYAGIARRTHIEAVTAADRAGEIATVSLGPAADLADRVGRLLDEHRLVVAGLPPAAEGDAVLDALLRARRPGDLLIVMQAPPRDRETRLLPAGAVVVRGSGGLLTSPTTRLEGVVAGIDIPVTILRGLALPVPRSMKGQGIRAQGTRGAAHLERVEARLGVVSERRTPTLFALLFAWVALTLALGVAADRRGIRAALRIGALAILWVLPVLLFTAWLAPSRVLELAIVVGATFGLGALTDRFVRWPRGPLVPSAVALVAYGADLAFGSPLIVRSLLGVNPRAGSRFYGLGNELESTLVVLLLLTLGTLLMRRTDFDSQPARFARGPGRSPRAAAIVACSGVVAAVFVGAGRLGADVGGVMTVGAGVAVMTVLMLPGSPSRRTIAFALSVPFLAVGALALLDIATGGNGHFTRTVLQAESSGALWDVVARRYTLAFDVLKTGAMPFVTVVALLGVAYAVRHRERIYAPLRGSPAWGAALAGGLAASVAGALFNDSGPILLVFGVFVLACVTAYVRGDPALVDAADRIA